MPGRSVHANEEVAVRGKRRGAGDPHGPDESPAVLEEGEAPVQSRQLRHGDLVH